MLNNNIFTVKEKESNGRYTVISSTNMDGNRIYREIVALETDEGWLALPYTNKSGHLNAYSRKDEEDAKEKLGTFSTLEELMIYNQDMYEIEKRIGSLNSIQCNLQFEVSAFA